MFLNLRVWFWFKNTELSAVKQYAKWNTIMNLCEFINWFIGIYNNLCRELIFACGILFSVRFPWMMMENDFHAACSRRRVLFVLLLGFIVQSIVLVANPGMNLEQYAFLGLSCFLLICIKLLYIDDSFSVIPADHAILVSRTAGFLFYVGWVSLLFFMIILGSGLSSLASSYLAATTQTALSDYSKTLVCSGFSGVIMSIGFIKSMVSIFLLLNDTSLDITIESIKI